MAPLDPANTMGPGQDLLQHLIIPYHPPFTRPSTGTSPSSPADNDSAGDNDSQDHPESQYWRYRGRFAQQALQPSSSMQAVNHSPTSTSPSVPVDPTVETGTALSLDDYLKAHPPPTPRSKSSVTHHPKPAKVTKSAKPAKPANATPVLVGARSSKHTIELHERYQALAIPQPEFTFQGSSVEGWWGSVTFRAILGADRSTQDDDVLDLPSEVKLNENGDVELFKRGPFTSKQETKEKLSEAALPVLAELESKGKVCKPPKKTKAKASAQGDQPEISKKEKEPIVNYVGQLLEFQRSNDASQPIYADYQLGSGFFCLATIDGYPEPFGSREPPYFSSKKAARQDAARHAVEHFKAEGLWPETFTEFGGIKKKKAAKSIAGDADAHAILLNSTSPAANLDSTASPGGSYAQRVAQLAGTLGLPTPQWQIEPSPAAPGFNTASCLFKNSAHPGPFGEVRHILGKKKAKEECARLTLDYLLGVKEQRMAFGRKMMEGVKGGETVQQVALSKPLGGDAEIEADVMMSRNEHKKQASQWRSYDGGADSETEDSEMGFEDAVEEMTS
ncbi:unnamed protein product [Periconia digitata]|uniref:DRBM domain-containing protein n=1 Tax=Periconia digitata TaxID=1303443 RepID=A0A9W4UQG9_9PLEO|nr:unnamed protein product [Periconia digitata]